ncbi:Mis12-Mtw1 protein family-domain-containing protein [Coemansia spiralis]|nr:Mis12-Mtw1 protein family-domain-containing protein [Coemansia spiralis]
MMVTNQLPSPNRKGLKGNDHGFVFKRGPLPLKKLMVRAIKPNENSETKSEQARADVPRAMQTPKSKKRRVDSALAFPEPKRRLTQPPLNVEAMQELSVPLRKPQPTPLISRTRVAASPLRTPAQRQNGFVVGRRADSSATRPRAKSNRKSTLGSRRRSTFSMRGKRASSIGGGFSAIPHESVDSCDFYRHISPELPEPIRLRQLLAWCARRTAVPSTWPELPAHVQTLLQDALKEATDDIHSAFERGEIATSWYHRPIESEPNACEQTELLPHPENKANEELKEKLTRRIAVLQTEHDEWVRELKRAGAEHARVFDRLPKTVQQLVLPNLAVSPLETPDPAGVRIEPISRALNSIDWTPAITDANEQQAAVRYIEESLAGTIDTELESSEEQIELAISELQVRLDAFHLDMHQSSQSHVVAKEMADRYLADLGFAFAQRRSRAIAIATRDTRCRMEQAQKPGDSSDDLADPTRDLLRTLAATLS